MRLVSAVLFVLILLPSLLTSAEIRALWVMPWDITSAGKIDEMIEDALAAGQTDLFIEVRYRADALYTQNRKDDTFPNPEPRSYILADDGFDPLEYTIDKAKPHRLRVHAWVVVFNATPTLPSLVEINHIFRNHYDWITFDNNRRRMTNVEQFGYFIDPGIPSVQDYVLNVLCDIVNGYPELDGLHLDYIRYPGASLGYHPISVERYNNHRVQYGHLTWNQWRTQLITEFMQRTYLAIKQINPAIIVSAAVIANYRDATSAYAQDWRDWLQKGIVDCLYPMAYHLKMSEFTRQLDFMKSLEQDSRIVVGLRAWDANGDSLMPFRFNSSQRYSVLDLVPRIALIRKMEFAGIALFSYSGIVKGGALRYLSSLCYTPEILATVDASSNAFNIDISPEDLPQHFSARIMGNPTSVHYQLELCLPHEDSWVWELWTYGEKLLFRRKRYYPQGNVTDLWDGVVDGAQIEAGTYILRVYPEEGGYQYYIPVVLTGLSSI
ncbi:MAG: family 10 glycosylhydrolase [Candidatus Cloacimonetes bacterium]|nr:family 10 glycosylhydrolase [Candidatus Cloacimonadota bacterium]